MWLKNPLNVVGGPSDAAGWTDARGDVLQALTDAGPFEKLFKNGTVETVEIAQLSTYQRFVREPNLEYNLERNVSGDKPVGVVFHHGGRDWLVDGNHRVSVSALGGATTVSVIRVGGAVKAARHAFDPADYEFSTPPEHWFDDYALRKAFNPDQPRDELRRWGSGGGGGAATATAELRGPAVDASYSADNARRAEELARTDGHLRNAPVRYLGGSRVALNPGEHLTVTGYYGTTKSEDDIYYVCRTANGRTVTLAGKTMRATAADDVPVAPAPAPEKKEKPPKSAEGAVVVQAPAPPPAGGAADYAGKPTREIESTLRDRTGAYVDFKDLSSRHAAMLAGEMDALATRYPGVMSGKIFKVTSGRGELSPMRSNSWADASWNGIRLNAGYFNDKGLSPRAYERDDVGEVRLGGGVLTVGLRRAEWSNFHPRGCDTPESIVAHEFGHMLDRHLGGVANMFSAASPNLKNAWRTHRERHMGSFSSVSTYASENDREAVAESFSQYEMHARGVYKGELSEGAKRIGEFMDRHRTAIAEDAKKAPAPRWPVPA